MVNEVQFSLSRSTVNSVIPVNTTKLSELGITGIRPTTPSAEGPTAIRLSGLFDIGNSIQGPQFRSDNVYQWRDTFSYQFGRHQMKWGASVEYFQQNQPKFAFENNAAWIFIGAPLGAGPAGPYVSFLGGSTFEYEQTASYNIYIRQTTMGYFFQDTWRATDRLTLNYGMRYEVFFPQVEKFNRVNNYKPGHQSRSFPTAPPNLAFPTDPGLPRGLTNTDLNNWGPKFGIAWDVLGNGKLSVRSGYGIYYSVPQSELQLQYLLAQPFAFQRTLSRGVGGNPHPAPPGWAQVLANNFSAPGSLADPFRTRDGFRNPFPFSPGRPGSNATFETPISATVLDPGFDFRIPYVQQYNLNVQWEFRPNYVLEVAYIGSQGRKLLGRNVVNFPIFTRLPNNHIVFPFGEDNPDLNFTNITTQQTFANSYYNAGSIAVNKRFSAGFDVRTSYTFAKSMDNLSSLRIATIEDPTRPNLEKARSNFDVRHRFVSSGVWSLPFGSGRRFLGGTSGAMDKIVSGWELSYIWTVESGIPVDFGMVNPTDGALGISNTRPDQIGGVFAGIDRNAPVQRRGLDNPSSTNPNARPFFNNGRITGVGAAFAACSDNPDADACFGNLGRNIISGPGYYNVDLVIGKRTKFASISETFNIEFRAEFFNLFNRPNFLNPNATLGSPTFGLIRGTRADVVTALPASRIIQFALKIGF
jgi:hypothetical protein